MSSVRGGSGSQRSIQRKVATTGPTGTSAHRAPTTTPVPPTLLPSSPSTTSPQNPRATSPRTGASTPRRCRPGVGIGMTRFAWVMRREPTGDQVVGE